MKKAVKVRFAIAAICRDPQHILVSIHMQERLLCILSAYFYTNRCLQPKKSPRWREDHKDRAINFIDVLSFLVKKKKKIGILMQIYVTMATAEISLRRHSSMAADVQPLRDQLSVSACILCAYGSP